MKEFRCYSFPLENYLIENGLKPIGYDGKLAVFKKDKKLLKLLESYWIKHKIFKEI